MDDAALTATLDSAKTEEARAILARDEAQRAVEGLDEASLPQRPDALRKRRERLVNDRLGLVGEIAQLEERAKTLGGAGPRSAEHTSALPSLMRTSSPGVCLNKAESTRHTQTRWKLTSIRRL